MKFKGTTIHLSHDDIEQAVGYWLNDKVLSYSFRDEQTINLHITRSGNCIVNFKDRPPLPPKPKPEEIISTKTA